MGKYDAQIMETLNLYVLCDENNIFYKMNEIKNRFSAIKRYYQNTIDIVDFYNYLDELDSAYKNNSFLSCLERVKNSFDIPHYTANDLADIMTEIGNCVVSCLSTLTSKSLEKIVADAYNLYDVKNSIYDDVWYKRGTRGICVDMERKISRLDVILLKDGSPKDGEVAVDTLMDTIVFCTFFIVSLKNIEK